MKQSSKPDLLSPEERQDRKAMKERKTTKSPKTRSNAPRKPQYVPMPLCVCEGTLHAGKYPANASSQSNMLKHDAATLPAQRPLQTDGTPAATWYGDLDDVQLVWFDFDLPDPT